MPRLLPFAAVLLLLVAAAVPAQADYVVFHEGRYMKVKSARIDGDQVFVELHGGGKMAFGSHRVKFITPDGKPERTPRAAPRPDPSAEPSSADAGEPLAWHSFADPLYHEPIARISKSHDIDPALVAAVVKVESNFHPRALSPKGAKGLMQLMPGTASDNKVDDPFDAESNLRGGVAHLGMLLTKYKGEERLALAAYNAGHVAVDKAGDVPPFRETERYVKKVLELAGRTLVSN